MQVCCVDVQQPVLPPSDIEILKAEVLKINRFLKDVKDGTANDVTFQDLQVAVETINEVILSLDNANDFFKIGGFQLLTPLLSCENANVIAATAELIADLCQNNAFCQTKTVDLDILPELVELLKNHSETKVRSKALYAISSICRPNEDAIKCLESTDILPVIMRLLEESDEKLRARTAFFLTYLSNYESFREALYKADLIGVLIQLLKSNEDFSTEHLLSALREQVTQHVQSRCQCSEEKYNLNEILQSKIDFYNSKDEYEEAKEHCNNILAICFPGTKK